MILTIGGVFLVVSLLPWAGATARARLRVLGLIGAAAGFRPCGLDECTSFFPDSTRLVRSDEHSAAVRVVKGVGSGGFLVPGFWSRKMTLGRTRVDTGPRRR